LLPGLEVFLPPECTFANMQNLLSDSNVFSYLQGLGLLTPGEDGGVEPAGDGNINWVRRVRAKDGRSWILKQARPALERFPEYQVTTERIGFEARYFETVRPLVPDASVCPEVHHFDPEQCVLVLEDLGTAERLDDALARGADVTQALCSVARFLGAVHAATRDPALAARFDNPEMQRLHGDHIFVLPYRENDFLLSPPLRARAEALWSDDALVTCIDAAYARYLEPRGALVHADVQSGNVLLADRGPVLLDAEIAHVGDPAFDLGVLVAHVELPAIACGDSAADMTRRVWDAYREAHGAEALPAFADVARYAGIELLRRTLGAARVPAVESDAASFAVLEAGLAWVREPADAPR
jgi:5-methylthioribose kinase